MPKTAPSLTHQGIARYAQYLYEQELSAGSPMLIQ